jgi:hypothetical protein
MYAAHDVRIQQVFAYIKKLMIPARTRRRQIGFIPSGEKKQPNF